MLRFIFMCIVLILVLSFFGISLRSIIMSPAGQENISFVGQLLVSLWHNFLHLFSFMKA